MNFNGSDLFKTFLDCNVEMGNIDENSIKAWFDTYSEDRLYFLNWLCTLNKSNVLKPSEKDEYDELKKNNLVYSPTECDQEINNIATEYPGILNVEDNLLDIDILQQEIMLLSEAELNQQNEIVMNEHVHKTISKEIRKTEEELRNSKVKKEKEFQNCLTHAEQLDNLNKQLQAQVSHCGRNLHTFQFATVPLFISNMNIGSYTECYNNVMSILEVYARSESVNYPNLPTNHTSAYDITLKNSFNDVQKEEILMLKERVFTSTWKCLTKQIREDKLKAELKFLNLLDVNSFYFLNQSVVLDDQEDRPVEAKRELNNVWSAKTKDIANRIVDRYIYHPKVNLAKRDSSLHMKRLSKLGASEEQVLKFLAIEILLHTLHEVEQNDVTIADKFFRKILNYISTYLKNCQNRTEAMQQTILEYRDFMQLPLEDRHAFIKVMANVLSNKQLDNISLASTLDMIDKVKNENKEVIRRVFYLDFEEHHAACRKITKWIAKTSDFLRSGPTVKLLVIPHQLLAIFKEIDELLNLQKKMLMSAIEIPKAELKKLAQNKWLQIRRQLWMYFMVEPSRIDQFITKKHLLK